MLYLIAYALGNGCGRSDFFGLPWLSSPLENEEEAVVAKAALAEIGCTSLQVFCVPSDDALPEEVDWPFVHTHAVAV